MSSPKLPSLELKKKNLHKPATFSPGKGKKSLHKSFHQMPLKEEISNEQMMSACPPPSPSTSSSSRYSSARQEEEEEEHEPRNFFDSLYETESESELEEVPEYLQPQVLETKTDFLAAFENLPEIDNISENISVQITAGEVFPDKYVEDMGHFVNPLTGEILRTSSSLSLADEEIPKSPILDSNNEVLSKDISEDITEDSVTDLDLMLPEDLIEDDEDLNKVLDSDHLFENFLEMEAQKPMTLSDDIDWHTLAKEEELKDLFHYTMDFIDELLLRVVETASHISPTSRLRQNLDKRKLLMEISHKTQELEVEYRVHRFLHQKVVEFFLRKKLFRPLKPETGKNAELERKKYSYALECLDQMLAQESNVKAKSLKTQQDLESELKVAQDKTELEIKHFENMVKKNLMRDSRPKCNVLIGKLLSHMSQCRQEVSKVRLEMLTKQHSEATLLQQLADLEDLGQGLNIKHFVSLQTETQALDKKTEERNVELKKLHTRVHKDIHLKAHYRERQKMLRNSFAVQRMALEELRDDKQMWRKRIYHLKLQRNRIRQQIDELSLKGGLLDKPALMWDYDRMCEKLREKRDIVHCLRDTLEGLQLKVETMTKRGESQSV